VEAKFQEMKLALEEFLTRLFYLSVASQAVYKDFIDNRFLAFNIYS